MVGGTAGRTFIVHRHRDAIAGRYGADPCERNFALGQKARNQRIFGVGRCQYHAVGLEGRQGSTQFAFDMVIMRVDEFEDHPVAIFGALQHPAEQHLVDPVCSLPGFPVGNRPLPVIDSKDEV